MKAKNRLLSLLSLLVTFSMLAASVSSISFATSGSGEEQFAAASTNDVQSAPAKNSSTKLPESPTGLYIVRLKDPSLSVYSGGVSGLPATSLQATGSRWLDLNMPSAQAYRGYLEGQQTALLDAMNQMLGRDVEVRYQYLNVLNGLAVSMNAEEAAQVARLPGVRSVIPDTMRELDTYGSVDFIGAPEIWNGNTLDGSDTRGEGVLVGVIDSGVNHDHPSFDEVGGDGYAYTSPYGADTPAPGSYCDTTDPTFCNDKLVGAYAFNGTTPEDTDGHGSHTASTAAGNVITTTLIIGGGSAEVSLKGVAPHAYVIAYKVCNPGCPGSASIMAVEQAVTDRSNAGGLPMVLNFSISGSDDPWNDDVDLAFLEAFNAGLFVSASAGNDGPGASTVAKTGGWNLTVAASTSGGLIANVFDVTAPATVPAALTNLAALVGTGPDIASDIENDLIWAGDVDGGANPLGCSAFTAGVFSDAIALIQRGTCSFADKVNNAAAAGAVAVVVYNNASGPPIVMGGLGSTTIPSVMLDITDGTAVQVWASANIGTAMARINAALSGFSKSEWGDVMGSFSSRGPSQFNTLKPDVTAPGVNILAAYCCGDEYEFLQGTSMSSPHGAGSAALMMALHPDWTPAAIKSALALTALTNPVPLSSGTANVFDGTDAADWFDMGGGRIALGSAGYSGIVLEETYANFVNANPDTGGDPSTLNLHGLMQNQCVDLCSWTRTVSSPLDVSMDWTASTEVPAGMSVTVQPTSFTLPAHGTQVITVTADVSALSFGTWNFAQIYLTPSPVLASPEGGGLPAEAHFPIAAMRTNTNLPSLVTIETDSNSGTYTLADRQAAVDITDLTSASSGLVLGTQVTESLLQDPTNNDPFNGDGGTIVVTTTVPVNATRLVAEIIASEAPDIDLFVGTGDTPSGATLVCTSATGIALEYCNIDNPAAGTWWILAQSWEGSTSQPDDVTLSAAVVPPTDAGNMTVTGPSSVLAAQPFDLDINWDEATMAVGDRWYGSFDLGTDPGNPDNLGTVNVDLIRVPAIDDADISLVKSAPATVSLGDTITYTLEVNNAGPAIALSVEVEDTLPADVTFVSASAGCAEASGVVTCTLGDLASGGNDTVEIVVTADAAGTQTNTASVTSTSPDPTPANNSDSAETVVVDGEVNADLSMAKTALAEVTVGDTITYTLEVNNTGPATALSVEVEDTLPAGVTFVSGSTGCAEASGVVTCALGDLASGGSATLEIVVIADEIGTLMNTASVSSTSPDPSLANNSDSAETMVVEALEEVFSLYLPVIYKESDN